MTSASSNIPRTSPQTIGQKIKAPTDDAVRKARSELAPWTGSFAKTSMSTELSTAVTMIDAVRLGVPRPPTHLRDGTVNVGWSQETDQSAQWIGGCNAPGDELAVFFHEIKFRAGFNRQAISQRLWYRYLSLLTNDAFQTDNVGIATTQVNIARLPSHGKTAEVPANDRPARRMPDGASTLEKSISASEQILVVTDAEVVRS